MKNVYAANHFLFFSFAAGLFTEDQGEQEVAFKYAVDRINMDRSILPKAKLIPIIEKIPKWDSFEAGKRGNKSKGKKNYKKIKKRKFVFDLC